MTMSAKNAWKLKLMQSKDDPRLIQKAKKHPDGWVYVSDEHLLDKDEVPPENIMGAWKVDSWDYGKFQRR